MKVLLDTNRLSDALAEDDAVLNRLEAAEEIFVPAIALAEIRSRFLHGTRPAKNEARLQWFLSQSGVSVLPVDASVSQSHAQVHHALRRRGQPIPTNDLWIAAVALANGLVLYTRDEHFKVVPGLALL